MKKADKFVCVSDYLSQVYKLNGYDKKKMVTIYNFTPQIKPEEAKISKKEKISMKKYKYTILYAGKLSLGKGADLLINTAQEIIKKKKDILFIFAGTTLYPIKKMDSKQLLFLGQINYSQLLELMDRIDIVCVPSRWPEPLSRVAIEAFSLAKPVLASNVGGLKELVSQKNGWLFKPTAEDLKEKMNMVFKEKDKWLNKGVKGKEMINNLEEDQIEKLILVYKNLLSIKK